VWVVSRLLVAVVVQRIETPDRQVVLSLNGVPLLVGETVKNTLEKGGILYRKLEPSGLGLGRLLGNSAMVLLFLAVGCGEPPLPTGVATLATDVTATQCKQWDNAMLAIFNMALVASILAPVIISPILGGLLGRRWWLWARPIRRVIAVSVIIGVVLLTLVPGGPWVLGLGGSGLYSNVDPLYFVCTTKAFGAEGLLFGLIAEGQAALSLWPMMSLLIVLGTIVGCLLALLCQRLWARLFGIRRKLTGAEE